VEEPVRLFSRRGEPSPKAVAAAPRLDPLTFNIKNFGYELARSLAERLPQRVAAPEMVGLGSKPSTQGDMESDWVAHWCAELKIPVVFHRKLWEFAFVLQALHEHGMLAPGRRGLGFGCGLEPLPSYLASRGVAATVTDLPLDQAKRAGWADSHQHAAELERCFQPHLVDEAAFRANVSHRHVDMNAIPPALRDYDFCWSICAFEHLGSIARGLAFLESAMATVRPGGISVHTTEFDFMGGGDVQDNSPTVLFQRQHFEEIASRLAAAGHRVAPLDFDVGDAPMDRFIDIPPYVHDWPDDLRRRWGGLANHLKLSINGRAATCFGLIVVKA
jgi:hypothetical protein